MLGDQPIDGLELHILRSIGHDGTDDRFCVVSMRPLTDATDRIAGAVGCVSDVTEQVRLRRQLERRANFDGLTSCLNRSAILDVLRANLDRSRPSGSRGPWTSVVSDTIASDTRGRALPEAIDMRVPAVDPPAFAVDGFMNIGRAASSPRRTCSRGERGRGEGKGEGGRGEAGGGRERVERRERREGRRKGGRWRIAWALTSTR